MSSYASHLLQHIRGNALQARLKCIAKCDAIWDKLCPIIVQNSNTAWSQVSVSVRSLRFHTTNYQVFLLFSQVTVSEVSQEAQCHDELSLLNAA